INVPKFLLALKASISNQSDYIDHINKYVDTADIVIWDDIGTKVATEFEHEHLLSLIDSRLLNNKSNIFTSNIIPNDLSSFIGDRLASRIINTSKTIEFLGVDKRGLRLK
ncbi:MAG: ATP-binding protein, partial [Romboutsia sp.]|nr:ATP-binding protein [Romboutsia sp.]